MPDRSDADILVDLGIDPAAAAKPAVTPRAARIVAGFEDIQAFVAEHGHAPRHGADRDIFERLYAVRLDRLRDQPECLALLRGLDTQGLLADDAAAGDAPSGMDDAALLATLGIEAGGEGGLSDLRHVRPSAERHAPDEIAARQPCADFAAFEPLFSALKADLDRGTRETRRFERKSEIAAGRFFIVEGVTAYVAEAGEPFVNDAGNRDSRLRVIFDTGTEANLLMRSLQRSLTQDPAGRRITEPVAGPLFERGDAIGGSETGTIYVLRSNSTHPDIAAKRGFLHKIGVTGGPVDRRFVNAERDPTFLMAPVEVVATFQLIDIRRTALENLLHRFFAPGRLEITIRDRFGAPVRPCEWFIVPLDAIHEAVARIEDGSLHLYDYAPDRAMLVRRG